MSWEKNELQHLVWQQRHSLLKGLRPIGLHSQSAGGTVPNFGPENRHYLRDELGVCCSTVHGNAHICEIPYLVL